MKNKEQLHTRISYFKSFTRIIGYLSVIVMPLWIALLVLIFSEIIGIIEEAVL